MSKQVIINPLDCGHDPKIGVFRFEEDDYVLCLTCKQNPAFQGGIKIA